MKIKYLFPALLLALGLAGCGEDYSAAGWTASDMAHVIAGETAEELSAVTGGLYDEYLLDYYRLDPETIEDGAVLAAGGASAQEIAVFRFSEPGEAQDAGGNLEEYLRSREADFIGYAPEEAAMLADAVVTVRGTWCALMVLPDPDAGVAAFEGCFESGPPQVSAAAEATPEPEQTSAPEQTAQPSEPGGEPEVSAEPSPVRSAEAWSYDAGRIIAAYRAGDWSELHENDRAILDIVNYVLTEVAPAGLSAYERELAIHDYIIENADYDSDTLSLLPVFEENPNNTNPYGALVDGRAVCSGYSSTFQLFMDLIDVECITVHGQGNASREEHAWNMVRLDGEWYCVDVTWDDPITFGLTSAATAHRYFNVTSEFMRSTYHYWDSDGVPEATATQYAWQP